MRRILAALFTTVLAAVTLAGCTVETQSCKNGTCTLKLTGAGASDKLGGEGGSTITLLSASGKTAKVKLGTNTGELTVGEPVTLDNATLELTEVKGKDSVVLKLVGSEASSSTN